MPGPYDDIIGLPRPISRKHAPMSPDKRAAQFLPFDALTGLGQAISEEARLTELRPDLEEDARIALDEQLTRLQQRLSEQPTVSVTFFVPDEAKIGGHFETRTGTVRRLDESDRFLTLTDGTNIDLDNIVELTLGAQAATKTC